MLRAPFFRVLFLCLPAVGIAFTGPASVSSIGAASLYYVSAEGCDNNDGRSPENAWRSLNRIGRHSLQPGDGVLLRRGDTWRDQLTVSSAGAAGAPVRYGTYGKGPLPRIAGTVPVAPHRNAVRNFDFAQFNGAIDDGRGDAFLHFIAAGGIVEAVSDTPSADGVAARLANAGGTKAHLLADVYLPADARVFLQWIAKSRIADGTLALRHQMDGMRYLQDDLQTWSSKACWRAAVLAGGVDATWRERSIGFSTDAYSGKYQLYFISGSASSDYSAIWLDDVRLQID
jgi:hypothetical protein